MRGLVGYAMFHYALPVTEVGISIKTSPMSKTVGTHQHIFPLCGVKDLVYFNNMLSVVLSLRRTAWMLSHRSMVGRTHMRTLTYFQTQTWTWTRLRCNTDIWGSSSETMTTHRHNNAMFFFPFLKARLMTLLFSPLPSPPLARRYSDITAPPQFIAKLGMQQRTQQQINACIVHGGFHTWNLRCDFNPVFFTGETEGSRALHQRLVWLKGGEDGKVQVMDSDNYHEPRGPLN